MAIRLTFTVSAVSLGWRKENGQSGVRWEIWDILAQCVRERYRTSEARLSLESDMGHLYNKCPLPAKIDRKKVKKTE